MDMSNSVTINRRVVNLPIGFRFHPTDEELVAHYLKRKVFSLPLPANVIPDLEIFQLNPWDLPGNLKEKRYFFTQKKMNWSGYWKLTANKEKQILDPASGLVIGLKKSYVFYKARGLKTQWVMQQFCLVGSAATPKMMMQVGDWVVCRVYQRKRRALNRKLGVRLGETTSCSSGITEVSSNELLEEEASSCRRY